MCVAESTRMIEWSCDEGCGRNGVIGEVGRDGRLSMSLSDEILLDEMIVNRLVV